MAKELKDLTKLSLNPWYSGIRGDRVSLWQDKKQRICLNPWYRGIRGIPLIFSK